MTDTDHVYIAIEGGNITTLATTMPAHVVIVNYDEDSDDNPTRVIDRANADLITTEEFEQWVADAKEDEAKGYCIGPLSWTDLMKIYKKLAGREAPHAEMWEWAKSLPGLFYIDKDELVFLKKDVL